MMARRVPNGSAEDTHITLLSSPTLLASIGGFASMYIEHLNFSPVFVETMETTDVLFQRPPPGKGHRSRTCAICGDTID